MGAGRGTIANDIAHDQETHLASFVENQRYTGVRPHKAVLRLLPPLICSRYQSSKKRGQLPALENWEQCQLTTHCDRQPLGSGWGLLSCDLRLIAGNRGGSTNYRKHLLWLLNKGKKDAAGRKKRKHPAAASQIQITIREVVFPEMAKARQLHSSMQIRQCHPRPGADAVLHRFQGEICPDRSEVAKHFNTCRQASKSPEPHQKRSDSKVTLLGLVNGVWDSLITSTAPPQTACVMWAKVITEPRGRRGLDVASCS